MAGMIKTFAHAAKLEITIEDDSGHRYILRSQDPRVVTMCLEAEGYDVTGHEARNKTVSLFAELSEYWVSEVILPLAAPHIEDLQPSDHPLEELLEG